MIGETSRRALLATGIAALVPAAAWGQARHRVGALFAGRTDDGGFMQAGYRGLRAATERLDLDVAVLDGIRPERALLQEALRRLAAETPWLVVAHGGQNNEAARTVAAEFPEAAFVVTQGGVTGPNLASYEVLQEQSAFLAGMLAGLTTTSRVVGHMSGIRVTPGLKGRAAFANGLAQAAPGAVLLTNFCGDQDNVELSGRVAIAMSQAGADTIFTMLNAGRAGAIEACRQRGVAQIGNVGDWVSLMPDVFIGSAVADSGLAMAAAIEDRAAERLVFDQVRYIGLERPEAVRLTMADRVPTAVRSQVAQAASDIAAGHLTVSTEWTGPEFATP